MLPYHGDTRDFAQPMPNGIGPVTLITEQMPGPDASAGPGIGARQERELSGRKYWVMPIEPIAPGGVLAFTVNGLPSTDSTGRIVAGVAGAAADRRRLRASAAAASRRAARARRRRPSASG